MRPDENTTIRMSKPPYRWLPLLIAIMTATALGTGSLILHFLEIRLVATTGESLALLAADVADKLDQTLFERYGDIKIMARLLGSSVYGAEARTRYLNEVKEAYLHYRWLGVTDATGRIVAATDQASVGQDQSGAIWFQAARDGQGVHLLDVSVSSEAGGVRTVGVSAPITGTGGKFLGVVTARVGLYELEDVFTRTVGTFQAQRGEGRRIEWQFLARDGTLIADSLLREEGTVNLRQLDLPSAQLSDAAEPGFVEEQHARRLVPVVTGYARTEGYGEFPGFQWGILVRMDRDDILAPIHATLWKLGLTGTVVWAPMLGLLLWMTGRLRTGWATAQQQGERLAAILTSVGDAVIVTDEWGRVAFMNPVAQALTGWTQEDAGGQDLGAVFAIVNEATRHPVESPAAKVLREGIIVGLANHTLLIARDGTEHPIDDSGAPIRDATGNLHGVVLVFRDISTRKSMEATLQNRAEALRGLTEAAQRITAEWDLAQILRYIVETAVRLTGAKYGALGIFDEKGERLTDFITVGIDEETQRAIGALPTGRGLLGLLGHKEEVLRLKDLGQHQASMGFPPGHPPMRTFLGVSIRAHGRLFGRLYLTEKKGAGEFTEVDTEVISALAAEAGIAIENAHHLVTARAAEAKHRLLLESTGEGIFGLDQDGLCSFINKAGTVMLGYMPEEVLGKNMHELIHHTRPDGLRYSIADCPIYRTLVTGQGSRLDHEVLWRRDGTRFWANYSASPILTSGQVAGAVVVFTDISERKHLEEQLRQAQKVEAVGRLAGGIAHDFNNLLMVMSGYSAALLRKLEPDNPLRRYPLEVKKAGERAAALTQQLLAFSRRQVLEPKVLDLNDTVTSLSEMLTRLIGEHIELVSLLDIGLGRVKADPGQIEQVIMNLVINGRDAMPKGGTLTIKTTNVEIDEALAPLLSDVQPGSYVMLTVSDTGHGMDEETQSHIFEPFFTTKDLGKGTGLGLASVYGIVKQSGGSISVQSEPGRGTTFTIYLPRVAESTPILQKSEPAREPGRGSETILLVEDEEAVRTLIRESLEEAGYRVLEASHGTEALMLSAQHAGPIHLLLTDVVMPHVSGRELADLLVYARPGTKVLYMTGYTDDIVLQQGRLEPGMSVIHKPVPPEALLRKVREVLDACAPQSD